MSAELNQAVAWIKSGQKLEAQRLLQSILQADPKNEIAWMWYVETWWEPWEVPPHVQDMRRWLEAHGRQVDFRQYDGITVTLFELKHEGKTS